MTKGLAELILYCIENCTEINNWDHTRYFDFNKLVGAVPCEHTRYLIYSMEPTEEVKDCCQRFLVGEKLSS